MICIIFSLLCSFGLAITGSLTFWKVTEWYDFYRPLVLFIAGYVAAFLIGVLCVFLFGRGVDMDKEYKKPGKWARFWLMQFITYVDKHALIKLKITGKEKLPVKERFLLVCNHRSNFDSMLITEKFGKLDIAFVTKIQNMEIPMLKKYLKRICYMPVVKDARLQSLEQFRYGEELVLNDTSSLGVFPEGRRQQAQVIDPFHEGVFNMAIHTQIPVVIFTLKGTENIHLNWPWRFTKVRMNILGVIPPEEYQGMTAKALSDYVRDLMAKDLDMPYSSYGRKRRIGK